jgi:hypothetical protein
VILETEANVIAGRVTMRGADSDLPLSEQVGVPRLSAASLVRRTQAHTTEGGRGLSALQGEPGGVGLSVQN